MVELRIPYQKHINKRVFDYISSCCSQQNNMNFASSFNEVEAKEDNKCYMHIYQNRVYLLVCLNKRVDDTFDNETATQQSNYSPLVRICAELQDVEICNPKLNCLDDIVIKLDLKKLYSTLSFSSDYQCRDKISLYLEYDNNIPTMYYKVSDTIKIYNIAIPLVENTKLKQRILESFINFYKLRSEHYFDNISAEFPVMSVTNVDKNSFLLPYFNHKDCLNFAISDGHSRASICEIEGKNYITNFSNNYYKKNCTDYESLTLLREDKFVVDYKSETKNLIISPGIWQLLVILQSNKQWKQLFIYNNVAELRFDDNTTVYHLLDIPMSRATSQSCYSCLEDYLATFELVGKTTANEIFLLNKLFPNSKSSYFDFSNQVFVGDSYVFCDDKDKKEIQTIPLASVTDNKLPLCLFFTELKHYIGGDLSQKSFMLYIFTNGINTMLKKFNSETYTLENLVIFDNSMSKKYLGL